MGFGAGSTSKNIASDANVVRDCANGCVVIDSDPAATTANLRLSNNLIVQDISDQGALFIGDAQNIVVLGNTIAGQPYYAIQCHKSTDITIANNTTTGSTHEALNVSDVTSARVVVIGNNFLGYGETTGSVGARLVGDAHVVRGNFFKYGTASSAYYAVDAQSSTNTELADNSVVQNNQNGLFVNGTGGRNNYIPATWDRNTNLMSAIFGRNVGFGMASDGIPTAPVDIGGDRLRIRQTFTPASATAVGNKGDVTLGSDGIYVCIATNDWRKISWLPF